MKKQLVLLVVCMAVTTNALAMLQAAKSPKASSSAALLVTPAPANRCCSLAWAKEKAGNVWAWTKGKAAATKNVVAPKLEVAKQFVANHKRAVIITSAVVAVAITAGIIYKIVKKHNAKKAQQKALPHLNVIG